jgi:hypothetical protein
MLRIPRLRHIGLYPTTNQWHHALCDVLTKGTIMNDWCPYIDKLGFWIYPTTAEAQPMLPQIYSI